MENDAMPNSLMLKLIDVSKHIKIRRVHFWKTFMCLLYGCFYYVLIYLYIYLFFFYIKRSFYSNFCWDNKLHIILYKPTFLCPSDWPFVTIFTCDDLFHPTFGNLEKSPRTISPERISKLNFFRKVFSMAHCSIWA